MDSRSQREKREGETMETLERGRLSIKTNI